MQSSEEKIVIHKNKITIVNPQPKSHHFVLLSHPAKHSCLSYKTHTYQLIPHTKQHIQHICIVTANNQKIINAREAKISTHESDNIMESNLTDNQSQTNEVFVIHITQYLSSIDGCIAQLQELSPQNILNVLEAMKIYGEMKSLKIQGHTIIMTYEKSLKIQKRFIIPNQQPIKSSKLYYFVLSEELPAFHRHRKLMTLPIQSDIQQIKIHHNWLVSRNSQCVLLVGLTEPFDKVQVIPLSNVQSILTIFPQKIVFSAYKYLYVYPLHSATKEELNIKLRGLSPYCFSKYQESCFFGGINHQSKLAFTIAPSQHRYLYFVKNFYHINFKTQKSITPDRLIYVCEAKQPITMMHFINDLNAIACYCQKKVYIVSLDEEILAMATVQHTLSFSTYIPYPFNLANYLGVMGGYLLRVGLDIYNNQIGLQLQQFKSIGKVNCMAFADSFYVTDEYTLSKCDILSESKVKLVVTKQPILFLAASGNILVYVASNSTAYNFHYVSLP